MTLEEAIEHCEEVADKNECKMTSDDGYTDVSMKRCAEEHRQLAEWLKEFKQYKEKALEQTRWIPVSERLPKAGEYIGDVAKYYLVQNEFGDMLVARYTHSEYWEQIYQFKPIGDEIVAWMPLPEPYKAESEVEK